MKKVIVIIAALAAMVLSTGCQEKVKETPLTKPVLTVEPATVVVDPESDAYAVKASWTSAGQDVSYKLEIAAKSDAKFENAEYLQFPMLEKEFTHKMIALYAENFGLEGSYSLMFRVTAQYEGLEDAVSNVVELKCTTKTPETPELVAPLLSADKVTVVANPNSNDEAVSLSWTSAAITGITPKYELQIGLLESFAEKISISIEGDYMYASYTGKEIAKVAAENNLGTEFTVYARVIATAEGAVSAISNVISIKVKIDYEIPEHLYIYFWAWEDPAKAQEMEYLGDGVFTWTGDCNQWQFKFITTLGEYWTGYFRDETAQDYWTLKDKNKNAEADQCMFALNDKGLPAGKYKITVNCKTMKVAVEAVAEPLPEHLYLDFWGWGDGTAAKEMTALGNGKFTWTGVITRWQFKFTTSNANPDDYWTGYFRDGDATDNYWTLKKSSTEVMFQLNDVGLLEGNYTINVDLNTLTVEMVPHIYLIGAFSWGWDRAKAEEMTYEGNGKLTWTGNLSGGDFKFLTQNDGDWIAYQRKDGAEDYWTAVRCCDQEGDLQFNLDAKSMPAGKYKIDFDVYSKAVKLTAIYIPTPATDSPVLANAGGANCETTGAYEPFPGNQYMEGRFGQLKGWTCSDPYALTTDNGQPCLWAAAAWGVADPKNCKLYQTFNLLPGTYKFTMLTRHSTQDNVGEKPQEFLNVWGVACAGDTLVDLSSEAVDATPVNTNLLGSININKNTGTGDVPKANSIEFTLSETTIVSVGLVYSLYSAEFTTWPVNNGQWPWIDLYFAGFELSKVEAQ